MSVQDKVGTGNIGVLHPSKLRKISEFVSTSLKRNTHFPMQGLCED